ncbi:g-type lectin s-receptor-like serine/threonine-protein kinase at4g27290 [Phtheirospermum japonicum]|uniref:non-specific serine/threonine protein kinase n=1 Tax=Phtheirospermum japonicum TaxID=374723 RepID=A0A830C0N8_9LAMI|nr:g-type lectin s-receptor-like serine/threonine-protein kinase at4g27290 [Phtheirospermum japonicum]
MAFFHLTTLCTLIHLISLPQLSAATDTLLPNQTLVVGQTLISQNQIFELGFFSPGKSQNWYLGIWYKSTPGVCVWVANRINPITDSQAVFLAIADCGALVISTAGSIIIWSANSSGVASNPVLQLLDTGNLVLLEDSLQSNYVWQSFDYPTDTWLPGMKMVHDIDAGLDKYLTSWRNPDDPSPGDYVVRIENHGLPEMVTYKGSMKRFRSGTWNGLHFSGVLPFPLRIFKAEFVFEEERLISVSEVYDSSVISRLTLETRSGMLERYTMNARRDKWNHVFTSHIDSCDQYGQCGPNGICRIDKPLKCECFKGFAPKFQQEWDFQDWSDGCTRIRPLNCESGDGFLEIKQVKYPDMLEYWLNTSTSLEECRDECLRNCNCTAYANPYVDNGGRGCLLWFGDLIDTREHPPAHGKQNIYIRLPASELDHSADLQKEEEDKKWPRKLIIVSASCGILVSALVNGAIRLVTRRNRPDRNNADLELPLFKFSIIVAATNNFSEEKIIGEGGFGPVYKVTHLDFGLARIFEEDQSIAKTKRVVGTYGYMAPEYAIDGKYSVKSDIFSLGVVLLEIVSGKKNRAFDHSSHYYSLLGHAWLLWKENRVLELMDESLNDTFIESEVKRCIQIGLLCVQKFVEDRPVMSSVLFMLGTDGAILPEPKEPGFFIERSCNTVRSCTLQSKMSRKATMSITDLEAR